MKTREELEQEMSPWSSTWETVVNHILGWEVVVGLCLRLPGGEKAVRSFYTDRSASEAEINGRISLVRQKMKEA